VGFGFGSDPTVRFLREQMEKAGCPVWPKLIAAVNCTDDNTAGGYMSGGGVRLFSLSFFFFGIILSPPNLGGFGILCSVLPFYSCPFWLL
jgi:hypothetical protein